MKQKKKEFYRGFVEKLANEEDQIRVWKTVKSLSTRSKGRELGAVLKVEGRDYKTDGFGRRRRVSVDTT